MYFSQKRGLFFQPFLFQKGRAKFELQLINKNDCFPYLYHCFLQSFLYGLMAHLIKVNKSERQDERLGETHQASSAKMRSAQHQSAQPTWQRQRRSIKSLLIAVTDVETLQRPMDAQRTVRVFNDLFSFKRHDKRLPKFFSYKPISHFEKGVEQQHCKITFC